MIFDTHDFGTHIQVKLTSWAHIFTIPLTFPASNA